MKVTVDRSFYDKECREDYGACGTIEFDNGIKGEWVAAGREGCEYTIATDQMINEYWSDAVHGVVIGKLGEDLDTDSDEYYEVLEKAQDEVLNKIYDEIRHAVTKHNSLITFNSLV